MKFFLLAIFAAVALADPEVKWSEDGQYKLVQKEPLALRLVPEEPEIVINKEPLVKYLDPELIAKDPEIVIKKEPLVKYLEPELLEKEPLEYLQKPLRIRYVPATYGIPLAYQRLVLNGYTPFRYRYQQISH